MSVLFSQDGSSPLSVAVSFTLVLAMIAFRVPIPREPKRQSGSTSEVARHAGRPALVFVSGAVHGGYACTRLAVIDFAVAGDEGASQVAAAATLRSALTPIMAVLAFMLWWSPALVQLTGGRAEMSHEPPGAAS